VSHDERGSALVEFIWMCLLLLLPLVYVLLSVFAAQSAAFGADAASRAAGRAFMLSSSQDQALTAAHGAARVALADQGIHSDRSDVSVSCSPDPDRCLSSGSTVTVVVTVQQPLPLVPSVLGGNAPTIRLTSTHVQPYGTFREDRS
jgi:Flp pilus assembly protein TadG